MIPKLNCSLTILNIINIHFQRLYHQFITHSLHFIVLILTVNQIEDQFLKTLIIVKNLIHQSFLIVRFHYYHCLNLMVLEIGYYLIILNIIIKNFHC